MRYAGQRLQYMGGALEEGSDSSPETRETIDAEVRRIVGEQFARAEALLTAHCDVLAELATSLLQAESVDGIAIRDALRRSSHADRRSSDRRGACPYSHGIPRPRSTVGRYPLRAMTTQVTAGDVPLAGLLAHIH